MNLFDIVNDGIRDMNNERFKNGATITMTNAPDDPKWWMDNLCPRCLDAQHQPLSCEQFAKAGEQTPRPIIVTIDPGDTDFTAAVYHDRNGNFIGLDETRTIPQSVWEVGYTVTAGQFISNPQTIQYHETITVSDNGRPRNRHERRKFNSKRYKGEKS